MTDPEDRDADSDEPGGGPADRPAGTVDEDANPPLSDPEDDTEYGGTGTPFRQKTPAPPSRPTRAARSAPKKGSPIG